MIKLKWILNKNKYELYYAYLILKFLFRTGVKYNTMSVK